LDATYELFNNKSIQAAGGDEERHRERKSRDQKKKEKKRKDGGFYGHIRHLHLLLLCMKQIGRKMMIMSEGSFEIAASRVQQGSATC
jgi:hypothetical protein